MNKELQDLAWRCLPREFREEVKNVAQRCSYRALALFGKERQLANKFYDDFINLFGRHNLTSDAEGEEILTVPRKRVEKIFVGQMEVQKCSPLETIIHCEAAAKTELLYTLFGSKCLPDNVESSEPNVDSLPQNPTENCDNKSHISADCNKPAEPKFKIGDKVKDISSPHDGGIYKVDDIKKSSNGFIYHIQGLIGKSNVKESDLEPYTRSNPNPSNSGELKLQTAEDKSEVNYVNLSQNIKNCDNRLQIAAVAMQGILSNIDLFKNVLETGTEILSGDGIPYRAVANASLLFADALIAESEIIKQPLTKH